MLGVQEVVWRDSETRIRRLGWEPRASDGLGDGVVGVEVGQVGYEMVVKTRFGIGSRQCGPATESQEWIEKRVGGKEGGPEFGH